MERSRDLLERLQAADRALSEERMSKEGSRRVARRISRELEQLSRPSRVGWIPMLTFVAGAALVLLFLHWTTGDAPRTPASVAARTDAEPAMTVLVSGSACRSQSEGTTKVWGACSLATTGPSMRIDTIDASHLEVDGRVVHLRTGSALFDVDKVHGEPIRVAIPQGEIFVVGTRFRVIVAEGRSEVELYEGRLEFHDPAGRVTPITAGQFLEFRTPSVEPEVSPEPEPEPEPQTEPEVPVEPQSEPSPRPHRPPATEPPTAMERDAGPVIEAAERLRREGRYTEAAATLREALKRRWPTRTADVLSYELGRLLQRRVHDRDAACEHWRAHLKRFAKTRYRTRIERALSDLQCE